MGALKRSSRKPRCDWIILLGVLILAIHVLGICGVIIVVHSSNQRQVQTTAVDLVQRTVEDWVRDWEATHTDHLESLSAHLLTKSSSEIWDGLRLVSEKGVILASMRSEEVGTQHWQSAALTAGWPAKPTTEWMDHAQRDMSQVILRVPLENPYRGERALFEAVLRTGRLVPDQAALTAAWTVGAGSALLLMVAIVIFYKCHKPIATITSKVLRHREHLDQELVHLRLVDESTLIAQAWNQLITMFEELGSAAGQSSRGSQLQATLEKTGAARLADAMGSISDGVVYLIDEDLVAYMNPLAGRLLQTMTFEGADAKAEPERLRNLRGEFAQTILDMVQQNPSATQLETRSGTCQCGASTYRVRLLPVRTRGAFRESIVVLTDISQQVRAEKARDEFLVHVAHELRTPMTNIQAYAETLDEFDDPEIRRECFNVINKETRRLSRLIEELLSRSQLDLGTLHVRRDDVDVLDLLREAMRDLSATADNKGISLVDSLPSKLPAIKADRDKLSVVVNNLLGNALKYSKKGGTVTLSCHVEADDLKIEVSDTGIGIGEEDQDRIFERMYRVSSEEVQSQVGTGVGLTTALEIARAHGGDIQVTSELGVGSSFTVTLPLHSVMAV